MTKPQPTGGKGELIYRQRGPVRLWHWVNAFAIFVMLMSGMMIFNAHPSLYWGKYGADQQVPWLTIDSNGPHGFLRVGPVTVPTTGVLGYVGGRATAFPGAVTIPTSYNLADARLWHFFFAWVLVVAGVAYGVWGVASRHFGRDVVPDAAEVRPRAIWHDVKNHLRFRFHGDDPRRYNVLQKLTYLLVLFALIPLMVLTGLTMSPSIDAAWPWLLTVFGGRQSARSIHFICASGLAGFIVLHLTLVVLAGPLNELRSIVTGWYRLPRGNKTEAAA